MPGERLLAIARLWLDEGSAQRVLEPLVADWQREQTETPPRQRWWVWTRAMLAFGSSVVRVSARSAARELVVPPSVRDVIVLSCAAAATIAVIVTLATLGGRTSPHNPAILGSVVLVALAPLIWRRIGVSAARPLPLFLKSAFVAALITTRLYGPHAIVIMLPMVMMAAAVQSAGPSPAVQARCMVIVYGPIALLVAMNPVVDLGSWPRIWRDVLAPPLPWALMVSLLDLVRP